MTNEAFQALVLDSLKALQSDVQSLSAGQQRLSSDVQNLKDGQQRLSSDIQNLQDGQQRLSSDVQNLKDGQQRLSSDVQNLKEGQQCLSSDVQNLKEGQQRLSDDVQRLEDKLDVMHAEVKTSFDTVYQALGELQGDLEEVVHGHPIRRHAQAYRQTDAIARQASPITRAKEAFPRSVSGKIPARVKKKNPV